MQELEGRFELIINDDCSTDGTTEIVSEYAERYPDIIVPILHSENQYSKGFKNAELYCLPHLRGRYMAICEGDDFWTDPKKLQKQVDFMEGHPDYAMCFHRATTIAEIETRESGPQCDNIADRDYDVMDLFKSWIVPTASMLMRRSVVDSFLQLKQPERMVNSDMFWVLCSGATGKIRGCSEYMSAYRIQATGLTYDVSKINRVKKLWPEHFICVYENFDNLDKAYLREVIAMQLWVRSEVQERFSERLRDMWACRRYNRTIFWHFIWRVTIKKNIKRAFGLGKIQ